MRLRVYEWFMKMNFVRLRLQSYHFKNILKIKTFSSMRWGRNETITYLDSKNSSIIFINATSSIKIAIVGIADVVIVEVNNRVENCSANLPLETRNVKSVYLATKLHAVLNLKNYANNRIECSCKNIGKFFDTYIYLHFCHAFMKLSFNSFYNTIYISVCLCNVKHYLMLQNFSENDIIPELDSWEWEWK